MEVSQAGRALLGKPSLGAGRPGWHIEDMPSPKPSSARNTMYMAELGASFSRITKPKLPKWSRSLEKLLWCGIGPTPAFSTTGLKMGNSIGNVWGIRDMLSEYDYQTVRYVFLSIHYRSTLDINASIMERDERTPASGEFRPHR